MSEPVPIRPQPKEATFDEFWELYWRKIDKALARTKWDRITNGGLATRTMDRDSGQFIDIRLQAGPEEIIAGLKRYNRKNYEEKTEMKYICHPATWLNRGRWMDES